MCTTLLDIWMVGNHTWQLLVQPGAEIKKHRVCHWWSLMLQFDVDLPLPHNNKAFIPRFCADHCCLFAACAVWMGPNFLDIQQLTVSCLPSLTLCRDYHCRRCYVCLLLPRRCLNL